jgi:hypothetical protein
MILNGVFMSNKTAALVFMALPNINKKTSEISEVFKTELLIDDFV